MIKILFICHGNICRSPMAEFVFWDIVCREGREGEFLVASAATSREEIGHGVHPGTRKKMRETGVAMRPHVAVQLTREDYEKYDYLIGMDQWNLRNMRRIVGEDSRGKLGLLLDYTDRAGEDIADPWYTGNFDDTYRDVREGCEGLFRYLTKGGCG